jgi:hypothetical protein
MKKIMLIAGLSIVIAGCYNDKADKLYPSAATVTCDTTAITFTHDIVPILNASCAISGCHDAAGAVSSGGYNFSAYTDMHRAAVDPSNILLGDVNWESGHNAMPKGLAKLSACDINKITRWVNLGALNN